MARSSAFLAVFALLTLAAAAITIGAAKDRARQGVLVVMPGAVR